MLVQYNPQSEYTIYHNARQTPCLYSTTHKSEYTIYHNARQTPCLYSPAHKSEYTIYHNVKQPHHACTVQSTEWVHNLPQC